MPYLTPDEIPEERDCRALLIPASSDWLAIVSGALTELVKPYNWEKFGAVTVSEAVAAMQEMIDTYYEGCASGECTIPGGAPVFRLNLNWEVEQLVDGEWVEPTGDYTIPPTPERGESTPEERMCMAAANAVYALSLLYEQLSDSFQEGQTQSEALAALTATIIGILGAVFGLIVGPLLVMFAIIFAEVYATVEFITADLWTDEFSRKLTCYFLECASEVGDVVHFDIPCITGKIAEASEVEWAFVDLRLLLQVGGIMNMLGSQAIDAAGATTAVEFYDCSSCTNECAELITFEFGQPWSIITFGGGNSYADGTLDTGFGRPQPSIKDGKGNDNVDNPGMGLAVEIDLGADTGVDGVNFDFWFFRNDGFAIYYAITLLDTGHGSLAFEDGGITISQAEWHSKISSISASGVRYVQVRLAGSGGSFTDGDCWLDNVCVSPAS